MAERVVVSPAKINLHLEVLGLRLDGFHELSMVMQTIDLADTLVLRPSADGLISLSCDRPELPTDAGNLIVRAGELLKARSGFAELGAEIELRKRIPIGAGLAGGSSNAAAALVGLNAIWGLGMAPTELAAMAAQLGSDVPFCLAGGTQLCFGRGEVLEPLNPAVAPSLALLLIKHPQASVSTPWAYGRCRELRADFYLTDDHDFRQRREALRTGPLVAALGLATSATHGLQADPLPLPRLRNDLQMVVAPEVPSVRDGLALLQQAPQTLAVAMSGSGPSLFALFATLEQAQNARARLADELDAAGFEAWCCRFSAQGVSLVA